MLPALAHWFGITGADLADMPAGEIDEFVRQLPPVPIGSVLMLEGGT